jgi:uncharacterized protein YkwD
MQVNGSLDGVPDRYRVLKNMKNIHAENHHPLSALRIPAAILFLFALLPACAGPQPVQTEQRLVHNKQPRMVASDLEQQIHTLINKERKLHSLPPLAWDSALAVIARGHSRDMAKKKYFSHYSQEGHDFSYRYKQAGYQCGVRVKRTLYLGAENILQNNLYDSVTSINGNEFYNWNSQTKIAETSVEGWMNSAGHRKNILTPHWRKEGIGVVISPDDKVYITQNFC